VSHIDLLRYTLDLEATSTVVKLTVRYSDRRGREDRDAIVLHVSKVEVVDQQRAGIQYPAVGAVASKDDRAMWSRTNDPA